MNTTPTKKLDTKVLLSTLWIVVMINMLKADILSLYHPRRGGRIGKNLSQHRRLHSPIDVGRRDHGETRHCHDHPVPRVEVRNQSLGQYRRGHRHHCLYLGRHGVISSLHLHRHGRDPLSAADHLVCMEMAQRRSLTDSK